MCLGVLGGKGPKAEAMGCPTTEESLQVFRNVYVLSLKHAGAHREDYIPQHCALDDLIRNPHARRLIEKCGKTEHL